MKTVASTCVYCGCGCRLNYCVENGKLVKTLPDNFDEVSEGKPCIKGLTIHEVIDKGRILKPLIRKNKNSDFEEVSWQEAYEFIYENTKDLAPDEIFFSPSGKITNEDDFVLQKFARIAYKTNSIDGCCTRLCHKSTVQGLINTFGNCAIPSKMNDIYTVDCLFIIGSNPASNYPVIFNRIVKAKKTGTKIVSVQSVMSHTSEYADVSVVVQPGTEVVLLNGIMNLLVERKTYSTRAEGTEGFERLRDVVKTYTPDLVCKLCGVKKQQLEEIVEIVANSKSFGVMHGMGMTQHVNALENIHSMLNLMVLKNGKLLSCRGEINVQGVGDMWCAPDVFLVNFESMEREWGVELQKEKGENIIEALLISPVKAAFISSFNPAKSMPNLDVVHENLRKMFLVQLNHYYNLTSDFADVILPTPTLVERNGTITNGERRVRLVRRVIPPLGESKTEWMIVKELSKFFGCERYFNYKNEKEITKEIVRVIPAYNIDVESVYRGNDEWADKRIRFSKFNPEEFEGTEDVKSDKYPFILTTFRSQYHFLTGEMTSKSETLKKFPDGPYCYLNEMDAKRLRIRDLDTVRVSSHVSSLTAKAKIDKRIPEGIVGMHFHFDELLVNKLFPTQFDEETFTPNFKMVAVRVEKIH